MARKEPPAQRKKIITEYTANLELHDLLEAIARLAHSTHFLIEGPHTSTHTFRRARRDGNLARKRGRLGVEFIDAREERLEAGEGVLDRFLVA
jgi:hypothetical protein